MSVGGPTVEIMTETRDGAVADARDVRLADLDFTVVDVETTGWAPDDAGITEIGAVRVHDGRVVAEFGSLVNPGRPVPAPITELTGIDDQMLTGAPPVAAVLPGLLAFARGSVLVAHNAPFDLRFLTAACAGMGLLWPGFEVLDTVRLARHLMATPAGGPGPEAGDAGRVLRHAGAAVAPGARRRASHRGGARAAAGAAGRARGDQYPGRTRRLARRPRRGGGRCGSRAVGGRAPPDRAAAPPGRRGCSAVPGGARGGCAAALNTGASHRGWRRRPGIG